MAVERVPSDAEGDASVDETEMLSSWGSLWQFPSIVVSLVLIGVGIYISLDKAPRNDFAAAYAQIERFLGEGRFELATQQLTEVIEPNLDEATTSETAEYHALVADRIALEQEVHEASTSGNNELICKEYAAAVELGLTLNPARTERWANALLALGRTRDAQLRLNELEVLTVIPELASDAAERRNRLFRRIIETTLRSESDIPLDETLELLSDYRNGDRLSLDDRIWAVARQAELRLVNGKAHEAVDHLLIDMRRIEDDTSASSQPLVAELYSLLARAYLDLGNSRYAEFNAQHALELFKGPEQSKGDALLVLAKILAQRSQFTEALQLLDQVVADYPSTASYLPSLLFRAELLSIVGEHDAALADYASLKGVLSRGMRNRAISATQVAESMIDRYDAALAMGKLDLALRYAEDAESLFPPADVPEDVLFRLASVCRQLAEDTLATAAPANEVLNLDTVDPEVRFASNEYHRRAGEYYTRHARQIRGLPDRDEDWATSLWLAADSLDLAGRTEQAVEYFKEYIGGRAEDDPRRAEVLFRLAQAEHALLNFEEAAAAYERVIREYPRSPFASGSHVPLARAYASLERYPEAEQQLREVIAGQRFVDPGALDYRDARVELGRLYYTQREYVRAIEQLDDVVRRWPDDPRIDSILFQLADSYRSEALHLAEMAGTDQSLSPSERQRYESLRYDYLSTAQQYFAQLADSPEEPGMTALQRDYIRRAHLYRADCAFELGKYTEAIALYDLAARRYADHHSSMVALIQIVNCNYALGDATRVAVAEQRARARLNQLTDSAFDAPDVLMDRQAWERWLENSPLGATNSLAQEDT